MYTKYSTIGTYKRYYDTYSYMHKCIVTNIPYNIYTRIYTNLQTQVHAHTHVYIYTHTHTHTHIYIYISRNMLIYIYIYIYTETHIYIIAKLLQ
jgi:16S rRNA A1518/A1519 N6-dimethyltransferase RsmA/KsgA/DIM1 with predicted DNA glycosylase/AP lyase activity